MSAIFEVEVTYTVRCAYCAQTYVFSPMRVGAFDEMPRVTTPLGWTTVNGAALCQRHEITARDRNPAQEAAR